MPPPPPCLPAQLEGLIAGLRQSCPGSVPTSGPCNLLFQLNLSYKSLQEEAEALQEEVKAVHEGAQAIQEGAQADPEEEAQAVPEDARAVQGVALSPLP